MRNILVINAGSSSMKYQLIAADNGVRLATGLIERIGEQLGRVEHETGDSVDALAGVRAAGPAPAGVLAWEAPIADHIAGFAAMIKAFAESGSPLQSLGVVAVGHRVVQGGSDFLKPTLIDDRVADRILALAELAPLHNPGNHSAIIAARNAFPNVPHVAVFDTSFHQTMPQDAYTYAIDLSVAKRYGVRRYGFHGISHQVVSRRAAALLGRPLAQLKQVVLHLGNGASACAIDGGRSVDTSMGFTPLEGLVMGTRSGDVDPGILMHLLRAGLSVDELDRLLNKQSGMLGLAGSNDMRDIREAAEAGEAASQLALDIYTRRIKHYVGAYHALLGGADAIVFTAGVGENAAVVRAGACAGLGRLGIEIDPVRNASSERGPRVISSEASEVAILVVPTDEEAEIAAQTLALVTG